MNGTTRFPQRLTDRDRRRPNERPIEMFFKPQKKKNVRYQMWTVNGCGASRNLALSIVPVVAWPQWGRTWNVYLSTFSYNHDRFNVKLFNKFQSILNFRHTIYAFNVAQRASDSILKLLNGLNLIVIYEFNSITNQYKLQIEIPLQVMLFSYEVIIVNEYTIIIRFPRI